MTVSQLQTSQLTWETLPKEVGYHWHRRAACSANEAVDLRALLARTKRHTLFPAHRTYCQPCSCESGA